MATQKTNRKTNRGRKFRPVKLLKTVLELRGKTSDAIHALGYDGHRQVLVIQFVRGAIYRCNRVKAGIYRALLEAESLGRAYNKIVRGQHKSRLLKKRAALVAVAVAA